MPGRANLPTFNGKAIGSMLTQKDTRRLLHDEVASTLLAQVCYSPIVFWKRYSFGI
jgi:hypothetical protein